MLTNWASFFGASSIILADQDAMFIGEEFPQFCTEHDVTLQTVIPVRRQSLGSTE